MRTARGATVSREGLANFPFDPSGDAVSKVLLVSPLSCSGTFLPLLTAACFRVI